MSGIRFNTERAERIFSEAHDAYVGERFLYSRVNTRYGFAPQNVHIPKEVKKGSHEHALFLFFTTVMMYASDSDMGFRQSVRLFEAYRYLFTEKIIDVDVPHVGNYLHEIGFVRPNQGAEYWHGSGATLFNHYEGKPLRVLSVQDVDEFLVKKRELEKRLGAESLPGIGPKIFSLMAIFFEELGLIDEMPGAFPADLHVQRICISLGIVEGSGIVYAAKLAEFLRPRIYDICRRLSMRPVDLSHALWFLGNRVCTRCPLVEGIEHVCPIVRHCGGAIPSLIYSRKGKWDLDTPRLPKGNGQQKNRQSSVFEHNSQVILDVAQHGRKTGLKKRKIFVPATRSLEDGSEQSSLF